MSDQTVTSTSIKQLPAYMQGYDEALLQRIFGKDDGSGVFTGGLIDDPTLFNTLDYTQAQKNALQTAVTSGLGTDQARQDFMDRYQPYFLDATGTPKYLPQAGSQCMTLNCLEQKPERIKARKVLMRREEQTLCLAMLKPL